MMYGQAGDPLWIALWIVWHENGSGPQAARLNQYGIMPTDSGLGGRKIVHFSIEEL